MLIKNYVYSHPVNVFIIGRLGLSVELFCELYGFKQGTLSSWVAREKTVATLPIEFLHALSLACRETMDQVYDCLCVLEQEYIEFKKDNKSKKRKKYIQK
ncbi:type III secretion system protein PrgN [Enterococcus faecium]|uniref:type III secretion system protein PrgN n=1 Tax=Enterococcus faecium TaxID=1352 RepID=UPI00288DB967|nr:type III secretion system protein PrgN [Enterococcus faecium]MDT2348406.1 type III secretion system protein PrgN [Enterococcus faecium]MDW3721373.1 type III secretion system protein PrgN [Enterococcus faecium]